MSGKGVFVFLFSTGRRWSVDERKNKMQFTLVPASHSQHPNQFSTRDMNNNKIRGHGKKKELHSVSRSWCKRIGEGGAKNRNSFWMLVAEVYKSASIYVIRG